MKQSENPQRRRLIKALGAGGVVVAGKDIPEQWSTPFVESVLIPAHAQTTNSEDESRDELVGGGGGSADVVSHTPLDNVLDLFLEQGHAAPSEFGGCCSFRYPRSGGALTGPVTLLQFAWQSRTTLPASNYFCSLGQLSDGHVYLNAL